MNEQKLPDPNKCISKSTFCHGNICGKRVWMYRNKKHEGATPSDYSIWNQEQGYEIERLALQLFKDGINLATTEAFETRLSATHDSIKRKDKVLFQPLFAYKNVYAYSDVLELQPDGSYCLFEIKSFSNTDKINFRDPSNYYVNDILLQAYILSKNDIKISNAYIICINEKYVRRETLEIDKLFTRIEIPFQDLLNFETIEQSINQIGEILTDENEVMRSMGSHCNKPQSCIFTSYCQKLLPDDAIMNSSIFHWKTRDKLIESGVRRLSDIDILDERYEKHIDQIQAEICKEIQIKKLPLADFLNNIEYPIYFLDFEAANFAIPRYNGYRPYQNIPFQFSLHILRAPDRELEHHEFIWEYDTDPSLACAEMLYKLIDCTGSIVAYHKSFEEGILFALSEKVPEYKNDLISMMDRIIDLKVPFSENLCCVPGSMGYSSIKVILPLLCPQLSYKSLDIQSGEIAIEKYWRFLHATDSSEREAIINALKEYCKLDTLAMYELYKKLLTFI